MSFMPELAHKGENLIPQGIAVVGMNMDNKAKAEAVRNVHGINFDWLVEPAGVPYSQFFSINSIPRVVLLDSNAKVLYNGHPNGPELKKALKSLGVNL